jgi:hypothetical protein
MRFSGSYRHTLEVCPTPYPTGELSRPRVLVGQGQKAAAQALCHNPSPPRRPDSFSVQLVPRVRPSQGHCSVRWDEILRQRVQKSHLSQRPYLFRAGLSQAFCSPFLSLYSRIPPLFGSSHPDCLAHPVPVVRFWLRLRLVFRLQGRPSPAQGPRRPPGAHPLIPPPPPFAASPAPGLWLRIPVPPQAGGGKDCGGCGLVGSRGSLRTTRVLGNGGVRGRLRNRPRSPNAFSRCPPWTKGRSAGVRGARKPCACVSASKMRA